MLTVEDIVRKEKEVLEKEWLNRVHGVNPDIVLLREIGQEINQVELAESIIENFIDLPDLLAFTAKVELEGKGKSFLLEFFNECIPELEEDFDYIVDAAENNLRDYLSTN